MKFLTPILLLLALAAPASAGGKCYREHEVMADEMNWKLVSSKAALDEDTDMLLYQNAYLVTRDGRRTAVALEYAIDPQGNFNGRQVLRISVFTVGKPDAIYQRTFNASRGFLGACFRLEP